MLYTTMQAFIKRHSVLTYYVLAFAISWGGGLLVIGGPGGIPATAEQFTGLLPLVIPMLLAGPSVSGILLTILVDGRAGWRELLARLLQWRVGACWYAVALLTAPLVFTVAQLVLSLTSPVFLPTILLATDKASFLLSSFAGALIVGFCEEIGWMGFAAPRLKLRYGVLTTGLIVGVLWGAWHLLMNIFWASEISSGELSPALYAAVGGVLMVIGALPAYRVLMVWVYDRTGGSLLMAILLHVSYAASTFIIGPSALVISGVALLAYGLVLAAAWWVIVATVAVANRGQTAQQPFLKGMA